jgi:hypothetical protein
MEISLRAQSSLSELIVSLADERSGFKRAFCERKTPPVASATRVVSHLSETALSERPGDSKL